MPPSALAVAAVAAGWALPAASQCAQPDTPQAADPTLPYRDVRRHQAGCTFPRGAARTTPVPRRITVEQFFAYDDAASFALTRELADWQRSLPSNVQLVRAPAMHTALARLHAQAFYTAQRLDKLAELDAAFYEDSDAARRLDSVDALAMLFASFGVEAEAFASEFNSVEVHISLMRAARKSRDYGITAAPVLVVGRRYLTTPELAGSAAAMLATAAERVAALSRR